MAINIGRVVAGGLLAGVVANAVDFVTNNYVLGADWQAWAAQHNIDQATLMSGSVIATWTAVDFVIGILAVWTYAAMRPRFGAGVHTAFLAGLVIYLVPTVVLFGFTQMGMMSMDMFVKGSLGSIVSVFGAAIAGAAVYKEDATAAVPGPTAARA
jgi:hypothetical protein